MDVTVLGNAPSILETELAKRGVTRRNVFSVHYLSVAMNVVAGTELLVTAPHRLAGSLINRDTTKLLLLPKETRCFSYLMAWHLRLENDAQNLWLRQTIRDAVKEIPRCPSSSTRRAGGAFSGSSHAQIQP